MTTQHYRLGLSTNDVQHRRAHGQGNTPPPPTGRTYWQIVRSNVFTPINGLVFALGVTLLVLGRGLDALLSTGIVLAHIAVSLVQEMRAKRTLDRVAILTRPTATVLRDGQHHRVAPEALVIGDVVHVTSGDVIVLDGRVLNGTMQVDESQLTGESDHVTKRHNDHVFSGSFCVGGSGYFVVEKVGIDSLANQITAKARAFKRTETPLQRQIGITVRLAALGAAFLAVLLITTGWFRQVPVDEQVGQMTVVVALIPNGLLLSISLAYALAGVRILRSGAFVQQVNATEALDTVSLLCMDKTGTLTTNQLVVDHIHAIGNEAQARILLGVAARNTTAPNKTTLALAAAFPAPQVALRAEVAFSSERKWSAVAFDPLGNGDDSWQCGGIVAFGAPEVLRAYCTNDTDWSTLDLHMQSRIDQGLRVLLLAYHPDPTLLDDHAEQPRLPATMAVLGLVSLRDEVRPDAAQTLEAFRAIGVEPRIISGDNPHAVAALARQAGINVCGEVVSGYELATLPPEQFTQRVCAAHVFGRISPQQKEQIVATLQAQGQRVAMIGDGVNDVLALKKADLGIVMESGSQVARGVAGVILLKDRFAALVPALAEGQRVTNGLHTVFKLFLSRILTIALFIAVMQIWGVFPLALRQSSLVTMLTVGIPSILLIIWAQPGRQTPRTSLRDLVRFALPAALLASTLGILVFFGTLWFGHTSLLLTSGPNTAAAHLTLASSSPNPLSTAQTVTAVFLALCGMLLMTCVESGTHLGTSKQHDKRPLWLAAGACGLLVIVLLVPPLRQLFALVELPPYLFALPFVAVSVWFAGVQWVWHR